MKQGVLGQLSGHTERWRSGCRGLPKRLLRDIPYERVRTAGLGCDTVVMKVSADPLGSWRWDAPRVVPN